MNADFSNLKRPRHPMADFVKRALDGRGLLEEQKERPAYQQNDYIGWMMRAKRVATREKRLQQMLEELETGGAYANIPHPPSRQSHAMAARSLKRRRSQRGSWAARRQVSAAL
jgi:hypothetical protein